MNDIVYRVAFICAGYAVLPLTSGIVFRRLVGRQKPGEGGEEKTTAGFDVGGLIGKCENWIVLTFVLAEAYTGLASSLRQNPSPVPTSGRRNPPIIWRARWSILRIHC